MTTNKHSAMAEYRVGGGNKPTYSETYFFPSKQDARQDDRIKCRSSAGTDQFRTPHSVRYKTVHKPQLDPEYNLHSHIMSKIP
jgi:hypothetical protein